MQKQYYRANTRHGRRVLRRAINGGHLVEVHTGWDDPRAHLFDHIQRLTLPDDDTFLGGLPQDLENCMNLINALVEGYASEFVRPVRGSYNGNVIPKYNDADLKLTMWDVDSGDSHPGATLDYIHDQLDSGIAAKLEEGLTRLVILFHENSNHTRDPANLRSFIQSIDSRVRNYVLEDEEDDEEEDQTQFIPKWDLTTAEIRTLLREISWDSDYEGH